MGAIERVIISGGGTGGHIHPALAIADEIKRRNPSCSIQFVGALGRMEMVKVPAAGYDIEGLWISGIERKIISIKNLSFPFKLLSSLLKAGKLLRKHKPQIVIGVGGFASGPILFRASRKGIPTLIQEQNSFPGITNRILAKKVDKVCAGFPGLSRWFPSEKITETGNPLREGVLKLLNGSTVKGAAEHFKLSPDKPIVFVMGGSLGAASMNSAVKNMIEDFISKGEALYSIIWQCGERYLSENSNWLDEKQKTHPWLEESVTCLGFIDRMDLAYSAAYIIASRAGAMSISELALVAKPTILIPSPHVAEDHQTKNALSLVDRDAAQMIVDSEVQQKLGNAVQDLLSDESKTKAMCEALRKAAQPEACSKIVDEIELLLKSKS
ncbi:MAG: undecaprenyldiphospho-muramoylpentapeptide beta-N-acetylglucosaminyltransferase [Crocinitomicaceae bacterium]|nr:undecaprenyldiphospho-muramoylpentapeptide beta-N-acetylglucosaminyltransferase [Crocinitomicaceae bacterium]|tara:strand:- start:945 stop:2093 length:1149 start_codon:yes stop_codon:yes gene_type:complete